MGEVWDATQVDLPHMLSIKGMDAVSAGAIYMKFTHLRCHYWEIGVLLSSWGVGISLGKHYFGWHVHAR